MPRGQEHCLQTMARRGHIVPSPYLKRSTGGCSPGRRSQSVPTCRWRARCRPTPPPPIPPKASSVLIVGTPYVGGWRSATAGVASKPGGGKRVAPELPPAWRVAA